MTPAEQQQHDSDIIFTAVSTSAAESFTEAQTMVVLFYVPDMSISRAGISHALKRLERHFQSGLQPPNTAGLAPCKKDRVVAPLQSADKGKP